MESRLKKIFHRKKDHSPEQQSSERSLQKSRKSAAATSSPALQTSLYDSALVGGAPQTGSYPIKGNNSSGALPKRKSSLRAHGLEDPVGDFSRLPPAEHHHQGTRGPPAMSRSLDNDRQASRISQPSAVAGTAKYEGHQHRLPEVPPSEDFSALSLDDAKIPSGPSQAQSSGHGHNISLGSHREGATNQINPSARNFNPGTHLQTYQPSQDYDDGNTHALSSDVKSESLRHTREAGEPYSVHTASIGNRNDDYVPGTSSGPTGNPKKHFSYPKGPIYDPSPSQQQDKSDPARKNSIPRKQLRDPIKGPPSEVQSSSPRGHTSSANATYPLQSDSASYYDNSPPVLGVLDRSRPISRGPGAAYTAERVMDRAKSNTTNTEVIETFAPAVVHETIHQEIHHIREEVITREIHTHDVYHRILPVIDVEVLPPRHFLPVEGGGLVEINSSEVPGRGQNWVIAETASKIPSDQRAPKATNRFSARDFVGNEGDPKRYITPEGIERTEETWVHPPELETGGRDTGQTWPMVFGEDGADTVTGGYPSSKPSKRKSSRKGSFVSSPTLQQAGKI